MTIFYNFEPDILRTQGFAVVEIIFVSNVPKIVRTKTYLYVYLKNSRKVTYFPDADQYSSATGLGSSLCIVGI